MAGESANRRAQNRRSRAANVAGGRPHRIEVKLSDEQHELLRARAEREGGISIQRLLVETTLGKAGESGRAAAVEALLEMDTELRRACNNLNQLVRYTHQSRELAESLPIGLAAVVRAALSVDATARWVMGLAPATTVAPEVVADLADLEWAADLDVGPGDM